MTRIPAPRPGLLVVCLSVALGLLVPGCGMPPDGGGYQGRGEGPGHRRQRLALSPQEELEVGRKAYREILSQYRGRILPADSDEVQRARQVTARIVKAAG